MEQESLCAALFDRSKRRKTAAPAPNKLYTKMYLPTVHFKKYMYLYSSETNYIPNFELIGSLWNSVEYIRRKYKTKYRNFGAAFAVNCQDKAGSKCSICITFFTIYPYRYGTSTNPGCSVSDPYRYSMNPDPYPAKNLIPDPEDPWIRIRIQAIS